ncbi:MAG: type II toxin-antitoxin system VapC family toxin [Desulfobulbaceae bacterium]|nr:type II toxin-antitoxin system VapC family toxin [Desulfobulbaceae bacterium]
MIVVDTNVVCYFYLDSVYSSLAENVFKKDSRWSVPFLWRSEFRSVLSLYVKKKLLTLSEAIEIFEFAEELLKNNEYNVNAVQVLNLSYESGCSAYDCEFVNLAKDLNVPLVTEDKKVLNSFPDTAISMKKFVRVAL